MLVMVTLKKWYYTKRAGALLNAYKERQKDGQDAIWLWWNMRDIILLNGDYVQERTKLQLLDAIYELGKVIF